MMYLQGRLGIPAEAPRNVSNFSFMPPCNVSDTDGCVISLPQAYTAFALAFVTIIGNSLVVLAILKDPFNELRTIPNYLVLNLAVCDLVVGIPSEVLLGVLHFNASFNIYWVAYTSLYFSMNASALTILTLAFERFIVVSAPLKSNEFLIYSHLKLAIVYIWLIAAVVAMLARLSSTSVQEYRLIITDVIGIPTMIFMFAIYLRIFYLVRRTLRRDLEASTDGEQQSLLGSVELVFDNIRQREREVALSVFLFVGVFALCWSPCFVMENILHIHPHLHTRVAKWIRFSGLLNSAVNPVIYALRFTKFRKAICKILCGYFYRPENLSVL